MNRRTTIITGLLLIALVGVVFVVMGSSKSSMNMADDMSTNNTPANPSSTSMQTPNQIEIRDFEFAPGKMTVKKGTKVTWVNNDDARHDITPDEESAAFKKSELLAKGESYSLTFDTVGTYSYHCSPHPYMKAVIEVTE